MKRTIVTAALLVLSAAALFAQPGNKRSLRDENRCIRKGIRNGRLTYAEAARLKAEEQRLKADAIRFKSNDGVLSPIERKRLRAAESRLDRQILKQRHDGQRRF